MKIKKYTVGIKGVNFTNTKEVYAKGKRAARWTYINLYAPPMTKYSKTAAY